MALFNKLFSRLKTTQQKIHEDNVSNRSTAFNTEQIRVVLFRECDFRSRKLLFDSDATEKIPLEKAEQDKKYVEVNNGFGYSIISKQNSDYHQLSEMVFGSVAMSFRGTYLKIHNLTNPSRIMFTQVFQNPHTRRYKTSSMSSHQSNTSTRSSFEHSNKLDDSGASSTFSTSEQLSDRSTASDTILVCRRVQSKPLDVPNIAPNYSKNSLVVDSGCADQSFSSVSTGPIGFPTWESVFSHGELSGHSFASCFAIKRLLRSSTRSLQSSTISLPNYTQEVLHRAHHRTSTLGLSILVETPVENKEFLTQFFMEHIALFEALIWRTRQAIEIAYRRPSTFISSMVDITQDVASWLMSLLNGPRILMNLWHCLSINCDNHTSIKTLVTDLDSGVGLNQNSQIKSSNCLLNWDKTSNRLHFTSSFDGYPLDKLERIDIFNFSKFLKADTEMRSLNNGDFVGEKFLKDFCELVETLDVKDTNFFISTLLTAVLTHHLGWVSTVFPASAGDAEIIDSFRQPYNALWSQLTDLYGAIGHPIKTAQTVVTGSNKNQVITKILNSLTYFIRYSNVVRKDVERVCVEKENQYAEVICSNNNCIPKEYYKRYEDHLKEMLTNDMFQPCCSSVDDNNKIDQLCMRNTRNSIPDDEESAIINKAPKGLSKTKTHIDLADLSKDESQQDQCTSTYQRRASTKGLEDVGNWVFQFTKQRNDLKQLNKQAISKSGNVHDLQELEKKTENVSQDSCDNNQNVSESPCDTSSVIFVLGESDQLIGLKKEEQADLSISSGAKRKTSTAKRPSSLKITKLSYEFSKNPESNQGDNRNIKPIHSFESLCVANEETTRSKHSEKNPQAFCRSQSEPPENRDLSRPKYPYSQVKFNLQQYPQVVKNYMKSKNIELEGLSLGEKVFDKFATVQNIVKLDFSGYESDAEQMEALQTPSNASELEFTSDMFVDTTREESKDVSSVQAASMKKEMKIVNLPMPKTAIRDNCEYSVSYPSTVMKGVMENYISDLVLQGTMSPKEQWDSKLKRDLAINTQHSLLDQPVEESLAIIANTDTWEVQIMSSHTYVIDKSSNGVKIGMSQLVSSMLESLLQMWKSHILPQQCILHIEQRLQELCIRSKALAQLLLASEFCSIEFLTSTLRIEVNDVPLLMAVASTHTPEVTRKYGLSFQ